MTVVSFTIRRWIIWDELSLCLMHYMDANAHEKLISRWGQCVDTAYKINCQNIAGSRSEWTAWLSACSVCASCTPSFCVEAEALLHIEKKSFCIGVYFPERDEMIMRDETSRNRD